MQLWMLWCRYALAISCNSQRIYNSAILFHFMCVDYVVHIAFLCTELFLCFILVVFYIVFYIVYHCN